MAIPSNTGRDIHVIPLTTQWHKKHLPLEANGEEAVPNQWFEGGSVEYVVPRPSFVKEADTKSRPVKPTELHIQDFLKGGSL